MTAKETTEALFSVAYIRRSLVYDLDELLHKFVHFVVVVIFCVRFERIVKHNVNCGRNVRWNQIIYLYAKSDLQYEVSNVLS